MPTHTNELQAIEQALAALIPRIDALRSLYGPRRCEAILHLEKAQAILHDEEETDEKDIDA